MDQAIAQTTALLRRYADADENAMVVFYGSPYISETPVLRSLLRGRQFFYYSARCVTDREQRRLLAAELSAKGAALSDDPAYEEIWEKLAADIPAGERRFFLFDHFEHFFYEQTDFLRSLSALAGAPAYAGRLFLLLLSDDEVWVENAFVSRAGADAAAITGFVKRRESRFAALRETFPKLPFHDAVLLYAVFGGETSLWRAYDPACSFRENICRLFLDAARPETLAGLPAKRLADLVREPAVYMTILANLASGKEKLNDLYHATRIPRAKLSVYMKTLMAPGFAEKVFSYGTVGTAQTKKGVYRVRNALLLFYFSCIYPYESALAGTAPEKFYDLYLSPALVDAVSFAYRRICMEYIEGLDEQGRLPFAIADEGEWNGKAGTIDIVAESDTGDTLIGLCAYDRILTGEDYHFILQYAKQAGLSVDYCYLFSGEGFSEELAAAAGHVAGLRLIGMEELAHG